MKKYLSIILAVFAVASCFALVGCGKRDTLRLGMGIVSVYGQATDAKNETDGTVSATTTAAAVLINGKGRVVQCVVDAYEGKISYNSSGVVTVASETKTKGELGKDYGMSAVGKTEWYEQAAAFCKVVNGKNAKEIKALLAENGKGNQEVIDAGCTIVVSDFIRALEKAFEGARKTEATVNDTLSIGFSTNYEKAINATEKQDGVCDMVSSISAVVVDNDKRVVAIKTDASLINFSFSQKGAATTDTAKELFTKGELGKDYNMSTNGKNQDRNGDGIVKEWNEQAAVYDEACIGKTADEISGLVVEGYGTDSLQKAGCTIGVSNFVEATVKAVK